MKFETTRAFERDFKRLSRQHQQKFLELVPRFNAAAEAAASGEPNPWPRGLRIKPIQGAKGIWELTWSMSDPDGRATWEWIDIEGRPAIRWRRVGDHAIFDRA